MNEVANKSIKWLTEKLQTIVVVITAISSIVGVVYAGQQYLEKFAEDKDVANVQIQFGSLHYDSEIDRYEEEVETIEDKKIDGTATNSDLKKLHRIKGKIEKLKTRKKAFIDKAMEKFK